MLCGGSGDLRSVEVLGWESRAQRNVETNRGGTTFAPSVPRQSQNLKKSWSLREPQAADEHTN
jgi:hypothetical protein